MEKHDGYCFDKRLMNILQLVEESPVLDFSIPLLKKLENEENKIIILCMVPNLESWFDNRYSIFIL